MLPSEDEAFFDNLSIKQNKKYIRRYRNRRKIRQGFSAATKNARHSEHETDSSLKNSKASLFKKKKTTSESFDKRDLEEILRKNNNKAVTVPVHTEKDRSQIRIGKLCPS